MYGPRVRNITTVPYNVIRIYTDTVTFRTHVKTIVYDRIERETTTDFVFFDFVIRITICHDKIVERIGEPVP